MAFKDGLLSVVDRHLDDIIALRRQLHAAPELSGREVETAARVAKCLREAGLHVQTDIGGHGVVATIGTGAPCLALRADMDALPLQEATDLPWASCRPGVMHACGHDFHTAWLVGAALVLSDVALPHGTVKFIFQPAEEALGGAVPMIAAGVLEEPKVEAIVAGHVWPEFPAGMIGLRPGPNLAAADRFHVLVTGCGAHGAMPHLSRDPIVAAAAMVTALQTLVSRRLDPLSPAVVSVCQLHGGTAFNIIPATAELGGTVRTVSEEERSTLQEGITSVCEGIATAHNCEVKVEYERGVPPTCVDPLMAQLTTDCLTDTLAEEIELVTVRPSMGGEDFAFYLEHCPGVLLWIGCGGTRENPHLTALHDAHFLGAEECLRPAMLSLSAIALRYLETKQDS